MTANTPTILAREEDGTIQITITIPWSNVEKTKQEVFSELAERTDVPGFRVGHAPAEEVKKRVPEQTILERVLGRLLPAAYQAAIEEHKLRPVLSPKFELVQAKEGSDWQIRATTCEAPKVELGEYKRELDAARRASTLWVPGKGNGEKPKESSNAEKENMVIETLLKTSKVGIPRVLIDEEVNHRLSNLVDQTQKLGLTVEQYLASTGKTVESLREEYKTQVQQQIATTLILSAIADKEEIITTDEEVEEVLGANGKPQKELAPAQKQVVREIIKRRHALDRLVATI